MPDREAEHPFWESSPSHCRETIALEFRKQVFLP